MKTVRMSIVKIYAFGLALLTLQTAHAFYQPTAGRWLSRDPIEPKTELNIYALAQNNCINKYDPLGLKESDISVTFNGCDALTDADRRALEAAMDKAGNRLDGVLNGTITLPSNLSKSMAACIRNKLKNLGITCLSSCNPICWTADGIGVPGSDTILLCAAQIKKNGGSAAMNTMALLMFHEACHLCGKVGHSDPDDPYKWGAWLTTSLPLPR
jgi:hypothetical protein